MLALLGKHRVVVEITCCICLKNDGIVSSIDFMQLFSGVVSVK